MLLGTHLGPEERALKSRGEWERVLVRTRLTPPTDYFYRYLKGVISDFSQIANEKEKYLALNW